MSRSTNKVEIFVKNQPEDYQFYIEETIFANFVFPRTNFEELSFLGNFSSFFIQTPIPGFI